MFLHRLIDTIAAVDTQNFDFQRVGLRFKPHGCDPLCLLSGLVENLEPMIGHLKGLLPHLRTARAFSFPGTEYIDKEALKFGSGHLMAFNDGVVRLPLGTCWFEFPDGKGETKGFLVERLEDGVVRGWRASLHGAPLFDEDQLSTPGCHTVSMFPRAAVPPEADLPPEAGPSMMTFKVDDPLHELGLPLTEERMLETLQDNYSSMLHGMMVLASSRKSIRTIPAKPFANRRRRERGLAPVPDYSEVRAAEGWHPFEPIAGTAV